MRPKKARIEFHCLQQNVKFARSEYGVDSSVAIVERMPTIGHMTEQMTLPMRDFGLPPNDEMYQALLDRNAEYDGVFFVGVKSTGIFCRPTCPARKPLKKNIEFFATAADAMAGGFRACKRCRPMEVAGQLPDWLQPLLERVESDPTRRWTDQDVRDFGVDPTRASRWFKSNHGITFHGYMRCRRLSAALAQLSVGDDATEVAFQAGYSSLSGFRDAFQKWFGATPGQVSSSNTLLVNRILTSLGPMVVAANSDHLCLLEFADRRMLETQVTRLAKRLGCNFCPGENSVIEQTNREVSEYFEGTRCEFSLPIRMLGTEFQMSIWQELNRIPYGETRSYDAMAQAIGRPGASRAVGRANGDNRLAIVVPCHRVIRADGHVSGYGGGVRRKQWMLAHETSNTI